MARFPKGKGNAEAVGHAADMRAKKLKLESGGGGRSGCSVVPFVALTGAALMTTCYLL